MVAILFDLDGTLVDTSPDFVSAANQLLDELKLPHISQDKINQVASEGVEAMVKEIIHPLPSKDKLNELIEKFLTFYQQTNFKYSKLFPGMEQILALLENNNIPWGIVTNKPQRFGIPLLQQLNLLTRSQVNIFGDSLASGLKKPDPEPLLVACNTINVEPTACVYIGDHLRDIQAGNQAGMTTVSALFGYISNLKIAEDWPANAMAYTVNELKVYLENWLNNNQGAA